MTYLIASIPSATVDFNSLDESGCVTAALVDLHGLMPSCGDYIRLDDDDGNQCDGVITFVADDYLVACPIWETWISGGAHLVGATGYSFGSSIPERVSIPTPVQAAGAPANIP